MSQVREVIIRFLACMLKIPYKTVGKCIGRLSNSYFQALWRVKLKEVGSGTRIGRYVMIHGAQNVSLGANISIAEFVHIWGDGGVEIGDNTVIAAHAAITSLTHDKSGGIYKQTLISKPVKIGANVWVGSGAIILPGLTLGDNSIIGAGAVVTRDVASKDIVVGIPARSIACEKRK